MASDYLSVDTGALDTHAEQLAAQAEDVRRAYEQFCDSLAAMGSPWGEGDEYAEAFTQWYASASKKLTDSLKSVADKVAEAGASTGQASANYVKNERSAE
ncbi:WXG100 family type VII secretion target [Kitasatospora indigofera]|uniref:WXG100 family type VII secretion target n=1 Tax=Kitasatospora indigofera TaxID=67307 RepID=UPI00368EE446